MIASIAIESYRSDLFHAPQLSMMRARGGVSPLQYLWEMKDNGKLRGRGRWAYLSVALIAVLLVVSNFTSTLLLGDLGNGRLPPETVRADKMNTTVNYYRGYGSKAFWSQPSSFPLFAEYAEPAPPHVDGVADTGPSVRALLPFIALAVSPAAAQAPARDQYRVQTLLSGLSN